MRKVIFKNKIYRLVWSKRISVGDLVEINGRLGRVESIGRYDVQIRDAFNNIRKYRYENIDTLYSYRVKGTPEPLGKDDMKR